MLPYNSNNNTFVCIIYIAYMYRIYADIIMYNHCYNIYYYYYYSKIIINVKIILIGHEYLPIFS